MSIFMICCHRQIAYSVIRGYKCRKILVSNFKEGGYLAGQDVDGSIILTLLLDNPELAGGPSASKEVFIVKSFKVKNKYIFW
jgi:hypothetical protein